MQKLITPVERERRIKYINNLKKANPVQLFTILGLHRGKIGEKLVVANKGTANETDLLFSYYYLGLPWTVGVVDPYVSRMVFFRGQQFSGAEFLEDTEELDPNSPLEVIEPLERWPIKYANWFITRGKEAIKALDLPLPTTTKPIFKKMKPTFKPTLKKPDVIKYEDRPDVGYDPYADDVMKKKPRFKLKAKPKLKLRE